MSKKQTETKKDEGKFKKIFTRRVAPIIGAGLLTFGSIFGLASNLEKRE